MNITELETKIKKAAVNYYNGSESISDQDYDILIAELKALDPTNQLVANGLAAADNTGRTKYKHTLITGTQAKCKDMTEFANWFKNKSGHYNISAKIDGASAEIQYRNGEIYRAISRGDGFEGEDITNSAKLWNNMVLEIPGFTGSIRGEFLLKESIFKKKYSELMKNARNATAGLAKRQDCKGSEDMSFIAYDRLGMNDNFETEREKMEWLERVGFEVPFWITTNTISEIDQFRTKIHNERLKIIDYNCDGVVVKQDRIDYTDLKRKTPTTQCAIKFALDVAITRVKDIEWSVSGKYLTPVCLIEPVELNGTTVSRASVANLSIIKELGLEIGSTVKVSRHGEVIPHIDEVIN
jgi:DNA ligase (NAD+)